MIKYKTGGYQIEIEAVRVERETAKCVYMPGGRRVLKITDWHSYFDTWEAAHNHLIKRAERHCKTAERALQGNQDRLRKLQQMQPPKQGDS